MIRVVLPYHLRTARPHHWRSPTRGRGPRHAACHHRRARSPLPDAPRHDPRPNHPRAPPLHSLLCLRAGLFERTARHDTTQRRRLRHRAAIGDRRHRRRLVRVARTCCVYLPVSSRRERRKIRYSYVKRARDIALVSGLHLTQNRGAAATWQLASVSGHVYNLIGEKGTSGRTGPGFFTRLGIRGNA